jgi:hypothetical protein
MPLKMHAREDQREENNMPMLHDAQEQGRMLVIDEAKVAHELLAVARLVSGLEPRYDPKVKFEAKKRFKTSLKYLREAVEFLMDFMDDYEAIPSISGDYLIAVDRIESIISKL